MNRPASHCYLFDGYRVDVSERLLFKENREVQLTPKVFDTLLVLLENSSHVLTKKELMEQVWPDSFVEENNLAQNISILRKALGENKEGGHYIQTVPKRGYRFVGNVRGTGGEEEGVIHVAPVEIAEAPLLRMPETMYARSGDVNIAYQVI